MDTQVKAFWDGRAQDPSNNDSEVTHRDIWQRWLEIETLKSPKRIERLATGQLHLVVPSRDEAIVIERVLPADPPAKSVVARR